MQNEFREGVDLMKVTFNAREIELPEGATLYDYLMRIGYRRVRVMLNGEQVQPWKLKKTVLAEGDVITTNRVADGC